ncbi:hypothetical protein BFJ66_g1831 [Fusarium oxysporum f. sp. cepae]|uniref:Uncharacterized protein n=1 Tax=Fusarium oxysporum f. sp. cepae TaxID=396571 RepID=A0A3L6P5J2_FUSOX|nr:hypothetical protein BFJ65_g534 [Fusarium oxysporum f. sp. cepae]RKK60419.1 hypothetical protein BFJ66_g1831 [Fusarium oxysporum f. sp. cepae]RKK60866.1 hypothetical protein BFJ67_g2041 [Fusarium oxysporum f. sp. cepae]
MRPVGENSERDFPWVEIVLQSNKAGELLIRVDDESCSASVEDWDYSLSLSLLSGTDSLNTWTLALKLD